MLEPLRRRDLVHGRRLPDPPAGPAAGHRHRAPRGRGDDRRPRLPQRGRQAALHGQERRASSTPRATSSATSGSRSRPGRPRRRSCDKNGTTRTRDGTSTTPEFDEDDPTAPTAASRTTTTSSSTTWGRTSTRRPATRSTTRPATRTPLRGHGAVRSTGLTWMFDETGADNQDHSATFVVTSSILDPARYPLYADSRSVGRLAAPGRGAVQPVQRHAVHGRRGATARRTSGWQDARPHRQRPRRADFKFSADLEAGLGLRGRRGARRHDATRTATPGPRCPSGHGRRRAGHEPDRATSTGRRRCPEGLATDADALAPVPAALLERRTASRRARPATWNALHRLHRRLDGLDRRPVGVRRQEGRAPITIITDWGTLGLGTWVDDCEADATARRSLESTTSRPTPAAGPSAPPPEGTDARRRNWTRRGAGVRGGRRRHDRRHRLHRLRLRGHERGRAAGVHEARPEAPGRRQGQPGGAAATPGPGAARRRLAEARARQGQAQVGKLLRPTARAA